MPKVSPAAASGIGYGPATAADRARFAHVQKASGGFLVSSAYNAVRVSGKDVGVVAVYGTKPGLSKSPQFQDQYVVQLMNAVTGSKTSPRFVQVQGQVFALSTGAVALAGWFEGDQVVLVYRQAASPELASLAVGVRATPS
jgi:hypothetical protein